MVSRSSVVFALALCACAAATDVLPCSGKSAGNPAEVELAPCIKGRCKLKKGTTQEVSVKFSPNEPIGDLKNKVSAELFGLLLPFVGVDGNSVCDKLFTESGEKASCPLKAGQNYVYKDSFPILSIYPSVSLKVHWELVQGAKEHAVTCFEVPAKIV